MNYEMTNCVIRARKDKIALRKRFCERQGLILIPLTYRMGFGITGYRIAIPKDFSKARAIQVARHMNARGRVLKLSHVAKTLSNFALRPLGPKPLKFWS